MSKSSQFSSYTTTSSFHSPSAPPPCRLLLPAACSPLSLSILYPFISHSPLFCLLLTPSFLISCCSSQRLCAKITVIMQHYTLCYLRTKSSPLSLSRTCTCISIQFTDTHEHSIGGGLATSIHHAAPASWMSSNSGAGSAEMSLVSFCITCQYSAQHHNNIGPWLEKIQSSKPITERPFRGVQLLLLPGILKNFPLSSVIKHFIGFYTPQTIIWGHTTTSICGYS